MKRWLRRILLACSLALMLAAVLLAVRGQFAEDFIFFRKLVAYNSRFGLQLTQTSWQSGFDDLTYGSTVVMPDHQLSELLPMVTFKDSWKDIHTPHWMLFVLGAAYPIRVWLHLRRKKAVGFPVEVSASEERVEALQAGTSAPRPTIGENQ